MQPTFRLALLGTALAGAPLTAQDIRITEWMYNGAGNEFVEFTNVGTTPVDLTGWSYDDVSAVPGAEDLSGFGVVAPGESVVFAEESEADIRAWWNLPATVKVVGGSTNNLGASDSIFLFDASGAVVDRLDYGIANVPGSIATNGTSGFPAGDEYLGDNAVLSWIHSFSGDSHGSYLSTLGDRGSPGKHVPGNGWNQAPGTGLAGTSGVPTLTGSGLLVAGKPITLAIANGLPSGSAFLIIGTSIASLPLKGGVLFPAPTIVIPALPLDAAGALSLDTPWPAGIPSAVTLAYQAWIPDPAGVQGFAATNGATSKTP